MCARSSYYKTMPQALGLDAGETTMLFNTYLVLIKYQASVLWNGYSFTDEAQH